MDLLKRFFKFVIPSIVSMWIFSLYTMVDGIFVAWGVGEHALTAVNLSMPFTSLVFMVGILLATGTSTVISIALGQGDLDRAPELFQSESVRHRHCQPAARCAGPPQPGAGGPVPGCHPGHPGVCKRVCRHHRRLCHLLYHIL